MRWRSTVGLAVVASILEFIDALTTHSISSDALKGDDSAHFLGSATGARRGLMPADAENRYLFRTGSLFVKKPVRLTPHFNIRSVIDGTKASEITAQKLRILETYAHEHKLNWLAVFYYLSAGISLLLFIYVAYGALFLGYRPYGMIGGPR
ncbi:uncharacterized protein PHALS_15496 [Plasmopara halstedii]|uniref:RxLR-like protein n=1 Tax=Plasmopara halstedii TaxID=4781 RepID=A0A0P1A4R0_PLAHL|nr:uncharacterized protein PHALS_15496 [Plasmopara halstedii]CEG35519.1 hypothetical protein PHALS_15496 [Plasmopara halstedii]|eukprot:XP_024571888.1 hypothetical protein PHALS_15496 [Plasmopara halstedii]